MTTWRALRATTARACSPAATLVPARRVALAAPKERMNGSFPKERMLTARLGFFADVVAVPDGRWPMADGVARG
eukprot:1835729-Prymnesium_polylepis.1